ncbi:MAG TPA: MgtC/SapB family protein [Methylomirabilota bacterium]|nr:MgtC/SapB family protein [Methylomirabilota bacterium]
MPEQELLSRLATALSIGLLVGLERGWQTRDETDRHRAAGLRTFALVGLFGGVAGALSSALGEVVFGLVFVGFAGAFASFHWLEARLEQNLSVTSVVAGLLTFLLGAYAVVGELRVAVAAAVAMTVLLALREQLHGWVRSLTWMEIRSGLILLAMTFLLLPVLPDRTVDPWDVLNPSQIWVLAILMASISFGGYIAVRVFGDRLGVILAALAGGLASSTATTLTLARLGRDHPGSERLLSAGILASGLVMVVRVGVIAGLLNRRLVADLILPLGATAAVLGLGALAMMAGVRGTARPRLEISNPLDIATTVKLSAFIALVMVATEVLRDWMGDAGVLVVAAVSGIADVDAVTISMARFGSTAPTALLAVQAIGIAVAVNTASKAAMAGWIGGARIGLPVFIVGALAIAAGAFALNAAGNVDGLAIPSLSGGPLP